MQKSFKQQEIKKPPECSLAYRPSLIRGVWFPPHTTSRVAAVVVSFPTDLENYTTAPA